MLNEILNDFLWLVFGNCLHCRLKCSLSFCVWYLVTVYIVDLMLSDVGLFDAVQWRTKAMVHPTGSGFVSLSLSARKCWKPSKVHGLQQSKLSPSECFVFCSTPWNMLRWRNWVGQASTIFGHLYAVNTNTVAGLEFEIPRRSCFQI